MLSYTKSGSLDSSSVEGLPVRGTTESAGSRRLKKILHAVISSRAPFPSLCYFFFPFRSATSEAGALLLQPGCIEGQVGALRRMCFGDLGFVEQLDALDDDKRLV